MLNLRMIIRGQQDLTQKLNAFKVSDIIQRGLTCTVLAAYDLAFDNLKGPGRKKVRSRDYTKGKRRFRKTRARGQADNLNGRPGSYPVPILTGNLQKGLGYVPPGRSKSAGGETFTASPDEAVLYNATLYARVIHEGEGSSGKYGPRPFIADAVKEVDIEGIMDAELNRAIKRCGL